MTTTRRARKPAAASPVPAAPALRLDVQQHSRAAHIPPKSLLARWISATLAGRVDGKQPVELTLRIAGPTEMRTLNREYRGKDYATNVLSFPFDMPADVELPVRVLGDIVLCAQTVQREARAQGKDTGAHWAHLVVHGVLHLLGMDHMNERDAARMESVEIAVLQTLGFPDPYETQPEET
ncbi:MAG: rRNA maturation RNase YbeY [Gammaproteobacteria bacterium]